MLKIDADALRQQVTQAWDDMEVPDGGDDPERREAILLMKRASRLAGELAAFSMQEVERFNHTEHLDEAYSNIGQVLANCLVTPCIQTLLRKVKTGSGHGLSKEEGEKLAHASIHLVTDTCSQVLHDAFYTITGKSGHESDGIVEKVKEFNIPTKDVGDA